MVRWAFVVFRCYRLCHYGAGVTFLWWCHPLEGRRIIDEAIASALERSVSGPALRSLSFRIDVPGRPGAYTTVGDGPENGQCHALDRVDRIGSF